MALSKEKILDEIKRTAEENGGIPLGMARFEQQTGIKPYDWKKYWARFGEAQQEAGLSPNSLQGAYDNEFLFEKVISVIRKLQKFPTYDELGVEKNYDSEFPNRKVFTKFGSKKELARKISEYAIGKPGYEDIILVCEPFFANSDSKAIIEESSTNIGSVYIFKHGKYYKIGKTVDTVRRGNELKIQLPESLDLIHEIKTDDPSGVETYWHKRFESKRMNGEWFNLNPDDIKAFKRWRRIF